MNVGKSKVMRCTRNEDGVIVCFFSSVQNLHHFVAISFKTPLLD